MKRGRKALTCDQVQGVCIVCNVNKQTPAPVSKLGFKKYLKVCDKCNRLRYNKPKKRYRQYKNTLCSRCGFVGDPCQLDVHHIDRNHQNNAIDNLITLCANCHRLEHKDEFK